MEGRARHRLGGHEILSQPGRLLGRGAAMRYLVGTTRLPFVPEFGNGLWSHHPATFTAAEEEFITLSALTPRLKPSTSTCSSSSETLAGLPHHAARHVSSRIRAVLSTT